MEETPKSLSNHHEEEDQEQENNQFVKIKKHPTYSTIAFSNQFRSDNIPILPSPLGSEQTISNEVKYLAFRDSTVIEEDQDQSVFFIVLYQCALYLKKEGFRSRADDQLILEKLSEHLKISLTHTTAKSSVGSLLLTNGYVLSCIAVLMARINSSPALLTYFFTTYQKFQIKTNQEEFEFYQNKSANDWEIVIAKKEDKDPQKGMSLKKKSLEDEEVENQRNNESNKWHNAMLSTKSSIKKANKF